MSNRQREEKEQKIEMNSNNEYDDRYNDKITVFGWIIFSATQNRNEQNRKCDRKTKC